jgi:hypothetical protein
VPSAMESTTTVESTAAADRPAPEAMETATCGAPTSEAASGEARSATNEAATAERPEARPTIETAAVESRPAVEAMEPRARADKDPVNKPAWTVITVWRARVWVIGVVPVGADRWTNVSGPESNSDSHTNLRIRGAGHCSGQSNKKSEQCNVFEISHRNLPAGLAFPVSHRASDIEGY